MGPHGPLSVPLQQLLANNPQPLSQVRAEFPPVKLHRQVLGELLKRPIDEIAEPRTHQEYVDAVTSDPATRTLIYSYDAFFGSRNNALTEEAVYPSMEAKIYPLRVLTANHKATVFLCLQHYTQFIDAEVADHVPLHELTQSYPDYTGFSWMRFVWRLREIWPEALIVIINADELATNWAVIAALVSGQPAPQHLDGIEAYPMSCLAEPGRAAYAQALQTSPPQTIARWVALTSQVFAEFGPCQQINQRGADSAWTKQQIQHSKAAFDENLAALRNLDRVVLAGDFDLGCE